MLASRILSVAKSFNPLLTQLRDYNYLHFHTIFHHRFRKKRVYKFHDDHWVKRRGGGWDEKLTPDNEKFLKDVVSDTYREMRVKDSPLKNAPWKRGTFTTDPPTLRCGVLALKIGSFPQWTKSGERFHVSLLQVIDNHVINYTSPEEIAERNTELWSTRPLKDPSKLGIIVVGALSCDPRLFTRAYNGLFVKAGVPPKRKLTRFFITPNAAIQPGTPLFATHFRVGDYVDVQAKTIDYGFHGCMRRYGFKGMPDGLGVTKSHRRRGSVGSGRKRRRIIAGTKMPGFMGNRPRMLKGLKIWRINTKYNVLYVHGPTIPGPMHCYVRVHDTTVAPKKEHITVENHPPFPTFYPGDLEEPLPEEIYDEELYRFSSPSIKFN